MKILYLIDTDINDGGAPRSSLIIARSMAQRGHEVYILMPRTNQKNLDEQIHWISLKQFAPAFPFFLIHPFKAIYFYVTIHRTIKSIMPDIIHAQMPRGARAVGINRLIMKVFRNIPFVFTNREYIQGLKKRYHWIYSNLIVRPANCVICLSQKDSSFWSKRFPLKKICVIANPGGKLFDTFSLSAEQKARAKYNATDSFNILCVGRMDAVKRWPLLGEIVSSLPTTKKINIYFAISYINHQMEEEVNKLEKSLSHLSNFMLIRNADMDTMNELYYLSDLHLIASIRESFGRTAMEAMARKTVVLSTDAGAISQTIGNNKYILPPEVKTFRKKIIFYLQNPIQLAQEKEKLFARYQETYSTDTIVHQHEQLYYSLCEKIKKTDNH